MIVPSCTCSERTVSLSDAFWSYRKADGSSMIVLSFSCSSVESVLHFSFKSKMLTEIQLMHQESLHVSVLRLIPPFLLLNGRLGVLYFSQPHVVSHKMIEE